jgi:hypothetical protein
MCNKGVGINKMMYQSSCCKAMPQRLKTKLRLAMMNDFALCPGVSPSSFLYFWMIRALAEVLVLLEYPTCSHPHCCRRRRCWWQDHETVCFGTLV